MSNKHKKSINLLITERDVSISGQLLTWALTYGRYIIIIIQIVVLSVFFLRFKLDRDHTDLKEAVSQKQALVQSVAELEAEIRAVQKKIAYISQITSNQDLSIRVMQFFQDNTPVDTTFTILNISNDTISFIASAKDLKSFNFLLRRLQQPNRFTDVNLEDIQRKADGRVEFRVQAKINPTGFGKL